MELEPDWDLQAVVRGFAAINKATTTAASADVFSSTEKKKNKDQVVYSTNLAVAEEPGQTGSVQLQPAISSYLTALEDRAQQQHKGHQLLGLISASTVARTTSDSAAVAPHSQTAHKLKRRKNQLKKVCHVPAEAISSDIWSWRKYGQKPIKGSPYPRGYYKCSSSKACLARKQVERNRSDPTMFIVTYTADHNHPAPTHKNSLAGTTRHPNPLSSPTATAHDESNLPTSKPSSSSSMATMSPAGSLDDGVLQQRNGMESKAIGLKGDISKTNLVDDVLGFLDMDVTNDFFEGLDEIAGTPIYGCFKDQILPSFPV